MSNLKKLCIKKLSENVTNMVVMPAEKWPDVKHHYTGFSAEDRTDEEIKHFFHSRWPQGYGLYVNQHDRDDFIIVAESKQETATTEICSAQISS